MRLSALAVAAILAATASSGVDAGCPFGHMHGQDSANTNREHISTHAHSLQERKTPLVQFKIPPKERTAETQIEGGVLSDKLPNDAVTDQKYVPEARENEKISSLNKGRILKEDSTSNPSEYSNFEATAYSNQNVGDGYAIPDGGYAAVRQDVINMVLTNNQDFWPADFTSPVGPSYGGLLIRLAWHCSGTYRTSDGRGGCDGGSIRFDPVANWADNASLNMALKLLKPVKEKYGDKLSWGDLIVLAANAAIESMGGPIIGFCGGRIDFSNGDPVLPLGPSVVQQTLMPCGEMCPVGQICPGCESPLGTEAIGLIYVDPEGTPHGDFNSTAQNIREVFGRMGFDDRMTVAAIGGGHAFGKAHGPCNADEKIEICEPAADSTSSNLCHQYCPNNENNPSYGNFTWEQKSTSGLEVTWTRTPTTWNNEFFQNLFDYEWKSETGPGGHLQWKTDDNEVYPGINSNIGMFTTDLALAFGDELYEKISREYARDLNSLTKDFGTAWYQLMSRDIGPRSRCLGDEVPTEIQPWEKDISLGPLETQKPNYIPIRSAIQNLIDENSSNIAALATLAVQCASTFRSSDYQGGCNGAAIRFPPSIDWKTNEGAHEALQLLEPIKNEFSNVSWSDLIVLAGQTAVEAAGGLTIPFCGGRVDANNGNKSTGLEPTIYNNDAYASIMYDISNKGLSLAEGVALFATPGLPLVNFLSDVNNDVSMQKEDGYQLSGLSLGNFLSDVTMQKEDDYELSNQFFVHLKKVDPDNALLTGDLGEIVNLFVKDNDYFLNQYSKAFNYMMTADLFVGPNKNACQGVSDPTVEATISPTPLL